LSDATTNPSLVLAAVSKPEYADIVQEAVDFAQRKLKSASVKEVTALAVDRAVRRVIIRPVNLSSNVSRCSSFRSVLTSPELYLDACQYRWILGLDMTLVL
jgi:transaldolase